MLLITATVSITGYSSHLSVVPAIHGNEPLKWHVCEETMLHRAVYSIINLDCTPRPNEDAAMACQAVLGRGAVASSSTMLASRGCSSSRSFGVFHLGLNRYNLRGFHEKLAYNDTNASFNRRVSRLSKLSIRGMDASIGGAGASEEYDVPQVFPRINVRDPFKRLGVSRDASEEEIREARNYLSSQYGGHEKSREAIEAAYDKIIMESFRERRKTKINLKSSLKKKMAESPPWVRALTNRVEVPTSQVILQRAALFFLLGVWSVMNPADGGPAFQVAVSLAACMYFLNDRLKSLGRAFFIGFGALVVGWISGSFLVPAISSYILPTSWSLELSTALFSYVFLWVACTFLK